MTDSAMLKASPDDPMLIKMVEAANRRLREAQIQEEDHAKDIPSDDLVYTKVRACHLFYQSSFVLDRKIQPWILFCL
jgi:hypothetical protein